MLELTVTQIAARLGVSERTAHRYIATGKLQTTPARRPGRHLVDPDELDRVAVNDPDEIAALVSALATVRQSQARHWEEIQELHRRVEALERQAQTRGPARRQGSEPSDTPELAPGLVSAASFAQLHGIAPPSRSSM